MNVEMLMSPVRTKILEYCSTWREIADIANFTEKSRTTILAHLTKLIQSGAMESMTISSERTRKKLYKTIPFKVKVGGHATGTKTTNSTKTEGSSNTQ